jgi:eukaryotic-like serine/threonine-protein kinase
MSEPTRLLKIFFEALTSLERPEEREAFLEFTGRDNPALRARLQLLLDRQMEANDFFDIETAPVLPAEESSRSEQPEAENSTEGVGTQIGRYRLLERLGEGGCGVVYLAEQQGPVRRRVALKIIRLGMDTESVIARFEMERQSLAMMDHPNIARVFDVGTTRTGRPFFVMQWVDGEKITDYCNDKRLDITERLKLFIRICQAIQHAHQKGVIHRDIKPSNILVWENDGEAVPKVIDFGIAKATEGGILEKATFTAAGQFVGTPAYMSPEQASGRGLDVDTRSDIFSLGSLLYELLTGRPPFDPGQLQKAGAEEIRHILQEVDPREPSAAVSALKPDELRETAGQRGCDAQKLAGILRGDLDRIVMKALEKDRKLRYGTADSLAADVLRYLNDEPVLARPSGRIYRLTKLVRRNKVVFAAGTLVLLTLVIGLGASTWMFFRANQARDAAERARSNEEKLRQSAIVRENISQVAVLMSEGKTEEADAMLRQTPLATIEPSLEAANVLRSLGGWNAIRGRWPQASECYLLLTQANRLSSPEQILKNSDLVAPGPALAENGDLEDYGEFRKWALSFFRNSSDPWTAQQVIQATLVLPADQDFLRELEPVGEVLKRSQLEKRKLKPGWNTQLAIWQAWSLSLLEYRRGDFEQAVSWGNKALEIRNPAACLPAVIHPVLAMANHRAGHEDAARAELETSRKLIQTAFAPELAPVYEPLGHLQGFWWDWVLARILFREADALIGE